MFLSVFLLALKASSKATAPSKVQVGTPWLLPSWDTLAQIGTAWHLPIVLWATERLLLAARGSAPARFYHYTGLLLQYPVS